MAGGPNCWGKGLQKRTRGWGQEGWGKGSMVRGVESIFKWSFEQKQVLLVPIRVSECTFRDEIGGNPIVMKSGSRKYVIISPKKVRKRDVQEISANYLCKKPPSWKSEKLAHFEFLNSNISVFGHDFKPKMEISTNFSVIWRWYKRLVIVFSGFWVKIGGWCGSSAQDPHHDPRFFLKLADPTAFLPQILTNTITPCAQLEYLREIRRHSIKKSVWNLGTHRAHGSRSKGHLRP